MMKYLIRHSPEYYDYCKYYAFFSADQIGNMNWIIGLPLFPNGTYNFD
jgi:hypothetical protein